METSSLLSAPAWAEETFGQVDLGHRSREERAVTMAAAMAADPAASLPKQMGSEADAHAAYRFLQSPGVSYEDLISPHVQQTRAQMRAAKQVLLIQDTTEVDYQQHPQTSGLGPIGNGSHHGYLLQSVLAIEPVSRAVLGLAHQEPFLRQPARHLGKTDGSARHASANEPRVGTQCASHWPATCGGAMDPCGRPLQ